MRLISAKNICISFLFLVFTSISIKANATTDPVFTSPLRGSLDSFHINAESFVKDIKYFTLSQSNKNKIQNNNILNLIGVGIDEQSNFFIPGNFSVNVKLEITTYDKNETVTGIFTKTFRLNYDTTTGSKYKSFDDTTISNAFALRIKITDIDSNGINWPVSKVLKVENQLTATRDYPFNCKLALSDLSTNLIVANNELKASWLEPNLDDNPGITEYDLEWSWIEESAISRYKNGNNFVEDFIFTDNATRVSIKGATYNIPLLYDGVGRVFVRVRAVQITSTGQRIEGVWSWIANDVNQPSENTSPVFFSYTGHENDLNWQANTNYAEEGKRKSVVQYFDGSLRNRQTVTKDNTSNTTIVAESFYDYQGRSVLQVLPAPTLNTAISYVKNFNQAIGYNEYPKSVYDKLDIGNVCSSHATPFNADFGAANYYSAKNPLLLTDSSSKYIPDATADNPNEGYPYTETRISPDGRVVSQSGVGVSHQIGSGHETKYYYEVPSQEELDALFGTDVGIASHYSKNLVKDANGQFSVSYLDMQGRTIATALAGDAPRDANGSLILDTLESKNSQDLTRQLIDDETNILIGNSIICSKPLVVVKDRTNYTFSYNFSPQQLNLLSCSGESFCYDCLYDLSFTVTSDCGQLILNDSLKNFNPGIFVSKCNNGMANQGLVKDFNLNLDQGSYTVTKTLTLSSDAQYAYGQQFLRNDTCKKFIELYTQELQTLQNSSNCNMSCESCRAALGDSLNGFIAKFATEMNDSVSHLSPETISQLTVAFNEAYTKCDRFCENDGLDVIRNIRGIMLQDVTPPNGQYAKLNDYSQTPPVFYENNNYNIFKLIDPTNNIEGYQGTNLVPDFKHPVKFETDDTTLYDYNYYNELDQLDTINLTNVNSKQFSDSFKTSWANQLLVHHPEFKKLQLSENELKSAYHFEAILENDSTWSQAASHDFIVNLVNRDSFFITVGAPYKQIMINGQYIDNSPPLNLLDTAPVIHGIAQYIHPHTSSNCSGGAQYINEYASMWQIALSTVYCREDRNTDDPCDTSHSDINTKIGCTLNPIFRQPGNDFNSLCPSDKDWAWKIFKNLYLSERRKLISAYLNLNAPSFIAPYLNNIPYQLRFINYANPQSVLTNMNASTSIISAINDAMNDLNAGLASTQSLAQDQYEETCKEYASIWITQLKGCPQLAHYFETSSTWRSDSTWLIDRLVTICTNGSDENHLSGSSSVAHQPAFVGGQYYNDFPQVVKQFLDSIGVINPTDECYDWIITTPAPYDKQIPPANSIVLTKPTTCECERITMLQAEWNTALQNHAFSGTFSAFMQFKHGTTISDFDLNTLTSLCNGTYPCKMLEHPIPLPPALQCSSSINTCISCMEYANYKNNFISLYPLVPNLPYEHPQNQTEINYNNAFASFINHKTGFHKTWMEYVDFQNICNANNTSISCESLDSTLNVFMLSPEYLQNPIGLTCLQAFVNYFNNHYHVNHDYSYWDSLFISCGTQLDICKEQITCSSFEAMIDSFYNQNGVEVFKNSNCQMLFVNYFNSRYLSNYTYGQLEEIYVKTCRSECELNICGFPNRFLLTRVYNAFKLAYPQPWNLADCQGTFSAFFNSYFNLPWNNIPAYDFNAILELYNPFVQMGCAPDLNKLCDPPYSCKELESIYANFINTHQPLDELLDCNQAFVDYFNEQMGTHYTYYELYNIYLSICKIQLSICSVATDCKEIIVFAVNNSPFISNTELCQQQFLDLFNAYFHTNFSTWDELYKLYEACGYDLSTVCKKAEIAINCEVFNVFVNEFKEMYPDPASQLGDKCEDIFTALFNERFGTKYSFIELSAYYLQQCHKELDVCTTSCTPYIEFISRFNNQYNHLKLPASAKEDLFTFVYNSKFLNGATGNNTGALMMTGSNTLEMSASPGSAANASDPKIFNPLISYLEILNVITDCGLTGFNLEPRVPVSINDPQVLLSLKQVYYIIHPNGLPDECQNDFQGWFNKVMKTQYDYKQIMDLYNLVCGDNSGYLCESSSEAKGEASIYIDIAGISSLPPSSPPMLCGLNEPAGTPIPNINEDPCTDLPKIAFHFAQEKYGLYVDSLRNVFDTLYRNKCLAIKNLESFTVNYKTSEYHYTLYYYDQAGNLVKTVPPEGVNKLTNADIALVKQKRINVLHGQSESSNVLVPNHNLITQYRYNTLNQVVAQSTPDAGVSKFYYDRLGRLAISQNAKQAVQNKFSYTLYDEIGRIQEVGQLESSNPITQLISQNGGDENVVGSLANWLKNKNAEQITRTFYDKSYLNGQSTLCPQYLCQENLRNRVSYSAVFTSGTPGGIGEHTSATYYSYDVHGNVDELLQDYGNSNNVANAMNRTGNRFKKIKYNYDLISGKVNLVSYQPGQLDAFYHRYSYDAENRLTLVETSSDNIIWEKDARYDYYKHGPLSRMLLGDLKVQGIDYAYTLQGWLKGINSTAVGNGSFDMAKDGKIGSSNTDVARDVYGMSLNYFSGDYKPIGRLGAQPFLSNSFDLVNIDTQRVANSLYNGNIASMVVNMPKIGSAMVYGYRYDQLNRIKSMDAFSGFDSLSNTFVPIALQNYKERITYDANGNIKTYLRNGTTQNGGHQLMDDLTYQYEKNSVGQIISNKLRYVNDEVSSGNYAEDIDDQTLLTQTQVKAEHLPSQPNDNYQYDEIGNLIKDVKDSIVDIKWNVYGKIEQIKKIDSSIIKYKYDASGNRIGKIVNGNETWYVRDAQGNVMSVYVKDTGVNNGDFTRTEAHLYGSSRIGMFTRKVNLEHPENNSGLERGCKQYEGNNHLGNVMYTISDKRISIPDTNNPSQIQYYNADVLTATDYYPGGMEEPLRKYQSISKYRFGFQDQEIDNEIYGEGNAICFKFRVEDTRLGRFFSTDPLAKKYPFYSPYSFSGNRFIDAIELEGLEPYILFKTEKYAALNFGGQFNGKSIKLGVEFAANIYRKVVANGKTYYYYDEPNKGTVDRSSSSLGIVEWFKGGRKTATIHSHGKYLPTYDNNNFSPQDNKGADNEGKTDYVTTPNGSLKKYEPTTKITTTESTNLPSDPKDPTRKNRITPVVNPEPVKTIPISPQKVPAKTDPIIPANRGAM